VVAAITAPDTVRIVSLLLLALLIATFIWLLSRWLLRHQQGKGAPGQEQTRQP
jgi:hypothetical protein